jgi:hypothetical protein
MQTNQIAVNLSFPFESLIDMMLAGTELELQKFDVLLKKLSDRESH